MYKRIPLGVVLLIALAIIGGWLAKGGGAVAQVADSPAQLPSVQPAATSLLANGNFDQQPFYWRPTNHFVGGMWYEWFWTGAIPEFIDGGHPHHHECYPVPPNGDCAAVNNHSQGYIRYGAPYIAGVYQPVSVTPCVQYRFEAYNANQDPNYHTKVGIDPTGQGMSPYNPLGGNPPINCPPDGHSYCPDPGIESLSELPSHMVWSPESNNKNWTLLSVETEALSTTITVWTYAAPGGGIVAVSSYWDAASLVQIAPPSGMLVPNGTLPPYDGSITAVTSSTTAFRADLSWQTSQPAIGQVIYHYVGDAEMPSPPPIANSTADFEERTGITSDSATARTMSLRNLRPKSLYDYAILARRPVTSTCQTAVYVGRFSTSDMLVPAGPLPAPSSEITGPAILPFEHSAYVIWQSSNPSYAQVLYHYSGPITPTVYLTLTNHVYLPLISGGGGGNGSTSDYELKTVPVTTTTTLHVVQLTGLQPDSYYAVVAVSAWSEGTQDKIAVSGRTIFRTAYTPTLMTGYALSPEQALERLQACLADRKSLTTCAGELSR